MPVGDFTLIRVEAGATNVDCVQDSFANTLRWSYAGAGTVTVYRDNTLVATLTSSDTEYQDTSIAAETSYSYQLSDDTGATKTTAVTVTSHAATNTDSKGSVVPVPRIYPGKKDISTEFNRLSDMVMQADRLIKTTREPCAVCATGGAIVMDCSDGCTEFEHDATADINSISYINCEDVEPKLYINIPEDACYEICGWPASEYMTGDECNEAGCISGPSTVGPEKQTNRKTAGPCSGLVNAFDVKCTQAAQGFCEPQNGFVFGDCWWECDCVNAITLQACGGTAPYTWTSAASELCGACTCPWDETSVSFSPNPGARVVARVNAAQAWADCDKTHQEFYGICTDYNLTTVTFELYAGV